MEIKFDKIKSIDCDQRAGFEEFVCQIARNAKDVPAESIFYRFRGAGGDGGVECVWSLPNGEEWGWQSKYIFDLNRQQLENSVKTALKVRPKLTRYFIALPFNLTGKTSREGQKSQSEKFQEYKEGWEELATSMGMKVSFELLSYSHLLDELTRIDSSGGKRLFWFDENVLTDEWFNKQLEDAIEEAGPRYSPKLNIKTPISQAFEAFGRTLSWETIVNEKITELSESIKRWDDCLYRGAWKDEKDFPEEARSEGESLLALLKNIKEGIGKLFPDGLTSEEINFLRKQVRDASSLAFQCRVIAKQVLEAEHGKGKADSVGFKQFMAEYQVSFPTRHYDTAGEISTLLEKILDWLKSPFPFLPGSLTLLLIGPQGIGKTHSICDAAENRKKQGLKSVVLFGHQFSDEEPWTQIKKLLGIANNISREQLLDIFDTAGEASGRPLLLFIDAINETKPKNLWTRYLSSFVKQISRCRWVKLCLSCRTTFIEGLIPDGLNLPQVEHTGFEGVEFDACFEFFRFYNIDPPSMPLMQPEYFNPLFLRLVCESLHENGQRRLPSGMLGFSQVIDLLFTAKNKKLSRELDYPEKENRVQYAMDLLTSEMHAKDENWLTWDYAKCLIEGEWSSAQWSNSLFNHLIIEGLIKEDRVYDPGLDKVIDAISISFERLGDHIITIKYLSELPDIESLRESFKPTGKLYFIIQDSYSIEQNRNLIEALAIQVPEKYGIELDEAMSESPYEFERAIVSSLQWRDIDSITEKTKNAFEMLIEDDDSRRFFQVAESLFSVAAIDGHPLNAEWLHSVLLRIPLVRRDGKLSPYLHSTFGKYRSVDRLIRWGLKADLGKVSERTAELWLIILCWFTSASDRRVRDHATKALVRIGEVYPKVWPSIIERFASIDDDYVIERCLASAYGALLRCRDKEAVGAISKTVYRIFFENGLLHQNALIIDYARLIIEQARFFGIISDFDQGKYEPPYSGSGKLDWPDEGFIDGYKDTYWELPKLHLSCMNDDFQHYTVPSVIRKYENEGVNCLDACRWIFKHVLDMGYTQDSDVAEFDRYILSKYGGGRSRPEWAERVGKKYQWIALYRLAIRLAILYPDKHDDFESITSIKLLLVEDERNIDPSILDKSSKSSKIMTWWAPIEYKYVDPQLLSDIDWLDKTDFPDNPKMLIPKDEWVVLNAHYEWDQNDHESDDGYPERTIWMHLHSFLVRKEDAEECWEWLQKQNFMGDWMLKGYGLHDGFWGEYPWAIPFAYIYENREENYFASEKKIPCELIPTANDLNIHFSFDAYQEDAINPTLPSQRFFMGSKLEWNSVSGYINSEGRKIFYDPAMEENGPHALLADKNFLLEYLQKNNLVLFWTILSEKQIIPGNFRIGPGYTEYSRAYMLGEGEEIIPSKPVIKRVKRDDTKPT